MIFGYGSHVGILQKKKLLLAVGMMAVAASASDQQPIDPRIVKLHGFLTHLNCPIASMARDFVQIADAKHLDWRLLPSIAVVESGGGKAYRNNNIFGWNAGHQTFPTIRSGIEQVADRLAYSPLYRQRNCLRKLHMYNEDKNYAAIVLGLMHRISPEPDYAQMQSHSIN